MLIRDDIVDDYVKALVNLGLSKPQARVYIALLAYGPSSVKQLASSAKMDRADAYRAALDLLQLGLSEKVIGNPAKYSPLAFGDVVNLLINRKLEEDAHLFASLDRLVNNSQIFKYKEHLDANQFVLIPPGPATEVKLLKFLQNAESEILGIVPITGNLQWLLNNHEDLINALKKNLSIRIIAGGMGHIPSKTRNLESHTNFQRRYLCNPPNVWFRIYDSKELFINMSANPNDKETPSVWTNNPCFVELAKAYFNSVWETAGKQAPA